MAHDTTALKNRTGVVDWQRNYCIALYRPRLRKSHGGFALELWESRTAVGRVETADSSVRRRVRSDFGGNDKGCDRNRGSGGILSRGKKRANRAKVMGRRGV